MVVGTVVFVSEEAETFSFSCESYSAFLFSLPVDSVSYD